MPEAKLPYLCRWFGHSFGTVLNPRTGWAEPALMTACRRCGRTPDDAVRDAGYAD